MTSFRATEASSPPRRHCNVGSALARRSRADRTGDHRSRHRRRRASDGGAGNRSRPPALASQRFLSGGPGTAGRGARRARRAVYLLGRAPTESDPRDHSPGSRSEPRSAETDPEFHVSRQCGVATGGALRRLALGCRWDSGRRASKTLALTRRSLDRTAGDGLRLRLAWGAEIQPRRGQTRSCAALRHPQWH